MDIKNYKTTRGIDEDLKKGDLTAFKVKETLVVFKRY